MKALLVTALLFITVTSVACLAVTDIPKQVLEAFEQKFPNAKSVQWEKESDKEWEVEFILIDMEYEATFLEDGTWLETENEISITDVPETLISVLRMAYPDYDLEEVEKLETRAGKAFEFEIEKGINELEIVMDLQGNIVNKETDYDDIDDEDDDDEKGP